MLIQNCQFIQKGYDHYIQFFCVCVFFFSSCYNRCLISGCTSNDSWNLSPLGFIRLPGVASGGPQTQSSSSNKPPPVSEVVGDTRCEPRRNVLTPNFTEHGSGDHTNTTHNNTSNKASVQKVIAAEKPDSSAAGAEGESPETNTPQGPQVEFKDKQQSNDKR